MSRPELKIKLTCVFIRTKLALLDECVLSKLKVEKITFDFAGNYSHNSDCIKLLTQFQFDSMNGKSSFVNAMKSSRISHQLGKILMFAICSPFIHIIYLKSKLQCWWNNLRARVAVSDCLPFFPQISTVKMKIFCAKWTQSSARRSIVCIQQF